MVRGATRSNRRALCGIDLVADVATERQAQRAWRSLDRPVAVDGVHPSAVRQPVEGEVAPCGGPALSWSPPRPDAGIRPSIQRWHPPARSSVVLLPELGALQKGSVSPAAVDLRRSQSSRQTRSGDARDD